MSRRLPVSVLNTSMLVREENKLPSRNKVTEVGSFVYFVVIDFEARTTKEHKDSRRKTRSIVSTNALLLRQGLLRVLALHLCQQLLDTVFFLDGSQAVFHVVGPEFGLGLTDGFIVRDLALHAVECGAL